VNLALQDASVARNSGSKLLSLATGGSTAER
jgi:hypothetical protein